MSDGRIRNAGRRIKNFTKIMIGAGLGFLAGYLFDPDRGVSRRTRLADQAAAKIRDGVSTVRSNAEYQKGVAKGAVHKITEPLRKTREFDNETLVQKVRSEAVGQWKRTVNNSGAVEIETGAESGQIVVRGSVESEKDRQQLLEMVREVSGVDSVDDRISVGS